jgi:Protein of unknown function (DUF3015)
MRTMTYAVLGIGLLLTGCVTQATIDSTNAPFQATTDATGGVSQATSDLTQPTKEFTSSTSPGSLFNDDGLIKSDQRLVAFAAYNFENLRRDIAQGDGEYLGSFAALLSVEPAKRDSFYRHAQDRYHVIYASGLAPRESFDRLVRELSVQ